jgi:predicted flap endonuclease-1-like 5' DNA nuclease
MMLVAAILGGFAVYVWLKPRLDALQSRVDLREGGAFSQAGLPLATADRQDLVAAVKACDETRQALEAQVATLEARYEDVQEQLSRTQASLPDVAPVLRGGDDREHESIQRLQRSMAQAQADVKKEKPVPPAEPKAKATSGTNKQAEALQRVQERAREVNFDRIGTATADQKDDLKRIKGIGPFIEKKLHAIGIYTFAQIARFTPEDDDKVNEVIEFFPGRIRRDDWRGQAEAFVKEDA